MFSQLRLNYLSYFAAVAVNGVSNFALIALLVRTFHADQYGLLVLAGTALSFSLLLDMGIGLAVTRSVAEAVGDKDVSRSHRQMAVSGFLYDWIGLFSAAILATSPFIFGPVLPLAQSQRETFEHVMWITALQSLITFHYAVWSGVAMGFQRHAIAHIANSLATVAKLAAAALVCVALPIPELISGSYAMIALITGITMRRFVRNLCTSPGESSSRPTKTELLHITKISASTSVGSVANKVVTESDRLAIGFTSAGAILTQYDVMLSLANFSRHVLISTSQLIAAFARLRRANEVSRELLISASGISLGSYASLFVFILIWGDVIVRSWVGAAFLPMLPALYCLMAATMVQSAAAPSHFLLVAVSDLTFYRQIHLFQIAVKLVFAVTLLAYFGAIGVAFSTLIAYLVTEAAVLHMAARLCNMGLARLFGRITLRAMQIAAGPICALILLSALGIDHTIITLVIAGALMAALLIAAIYRLGIRESLRRDLEAIG